MLYFLQHAAYFMLFTDLQKNYFSSFVSLDLGCRDLSHPQIQNRYPVHRYLPLTRHIFTFQENAPECLNLVHYSELVNEKRIVLMAGEYDKTMLSIKVSCSC